ncbi:hypothetical protein NE237_014106 [Protea cynaroides]|uniref:Uncharacterized protein n=1 Tax=Protea cynaroides TaxID=273540 RepID=A0A9Q0H2Y8_9MAGN|nr:hypothetical protein NE237_014106 [Protea cynaroides]
MLLSGWTWLVYYVWKNRLLVLLMSPLIILYDQPQKSTTEMSKKRCLASESYFVGSPPTLFPSFFALFCFTLFLIQYPHFLITRLVAVDGFHKLPIIIGSADLKEALQKLGSISFSKTQVVEVLWTPQKENDTLLEPKTS